MAKKKKNEFEGLLTEEQAKKLQDLTSELLAVAGKVVEEYEDLDLSELSELSSSLDQITQIHEDSPFLDEIFEGDSWKKIITAIPPIPTTPKETKEDDSE